MIAVSGLCFKIKTKKSEACLLATGSRREGSLETAVVKRPEREHVTAVAWRVDCLSRHTAPREEGMSVVGSVIDRCVDGKNTDGSSPRGWRFSATRGSHASGMESTHN